jgi:nondiscriminating aspartyl-tRNA synthetase
MLRSHYSKDVLEKGAGSVIVSGWVRNIRSLGNLKFVMLADRYGELQITAKKGEVDEKLMEHFNTLGKEDVIKVSGEAKKNKMAPGGVEIVPKEIKIIAKSESPLPLDIKIKSNLDTRLDYRFLDLRRPESSAIFRIKDVIQRSFVQYLEKQDFVLMNTPVIVAAATEGGTNLFPILYFEKEAFLGQSPQLYKQMLMASGFDKVCIVVPVFRAEEHDTNRHLNETTQMDIETAFVEDEQDALKYMQGVIHHIYKKVSLECKDELDILGRKLDVPKFPVKQITYDNALKSLKKEGIKIEWGDDLNPEAERTICRKYNPVIITKWPTDIRSFYSMPEPGNEKICRTYDMLIDGIEACSGAQRIHDHSQLVKEMERRKMNPKNFKFYLNAFRYGMPPHAGWSFGLERLSMIITGAKNIRECALFPRDRKRLTP